MAKYRVLETMFAGPPGKERIYEAGETIDSSEITGLVLPRDKHLELIEGDQAMIDRENRAKLVAEARRLGIDYIDDGSTVDEAQDAIISHRTSDISDIFRTVSQSSKDWIGDIPEHLKPEYEAKKALARKQLSDWREAERRLAAGEAP